MFFSITTYWYPGQAILIWEANNLVNKQTHNVKSLPKACPTQDTQLWLAFVLQTTSTNWTPHPYVKRIHFNTEVCNHYSGSTRHTQQEGLCFYLVHLYWQCLHFTHANFQVRLHLRHKVLVLLFLPLVLSIFFHVISLFHIWTLDTTRKISPVQTCSQHQEMISMQCVHTCRK